MKKIALGLFALAFVFSLVGVEKVTATSCGSIDPVTLQVIQCGNGPIVPQQPGGRFLKAGEEDCPSWFPSNFGRACYTMRAVGAFFIPLR